MGRPVGQSCPGVSIGEPDRADCRGASATATDHSLRPVAGAGGQLTGLQAGIDARYALTPQTAAYATLNPDFATIEADQEQVNLTRFEVSLKEKRQFFLEGQELFGQRIRTFYSRRIADILAGGKVLGKQGPWNMAFFSVESDPIGDAGRANDTVGRVQRDVLGRSNVALTAANRNLAGVNQGSVGVDTNLFFTKTFNLTAQVVKSWGLFSHGTEARRSRPDRAGGSRERRARRTPVSDPSRLAA